METSTVTNTVQNTTDTVISDITVSQKLINGNTVLIVYYALILFCSYSNFFCIITPLLIRSITRQRTGSSDRSDAFLSISISSTVVTAI